MHVIAGSSSVNADNLALRWFANVLYSYLLEKMLTGADVITLLILRLVSDLKTNPDNICIFSSSTFLKPPEVPT